MSQSKRFPLLNPMLCAVLVLAVGLSLGTTSGCMLFGNQGPSNVAQGLHYSSGNVEYDRFFDTLFNAQLKMGKAPQEEQDIRRTLAQNIGAYDKIEPGQLGHAMDEHTARMAKAGTGLKLTLTGIDNPHGVVFVKLDTNGTTPNDKDKAIIAAIDAAAQAEGKMLGDMRQIKMAGETLREDATALEPGIDVAFRKEGPVKRAEVAKNVKDAQALIPLMLRRADEIESLAKTMLNQIVQVANTADKAAAQATGPGGTPKIVLEEDAPEKPAKRKAPARAGTRPAAPRPQAKPAAAPKPAPPPPAPPPAAPKDDFEP